jgi:probable rRNA maturation factor
VSTTATPQPPSSGASTLESGYVEVENAQKRYKIDETLVLKQTIGALEKAGVREYDVGVTLTTDSEMRNINAEYRGLNAVTDVLACPAQEVIAGEKPAPLLGQVYDLGDVYISVAQARKNALEAKHDLEDELAVLIAHSVTHLLGYDHETEEDAAIMEPVEARILEHVMHITRQHQTDRTLNDTLK